jgi:hypothetical protein
LKINLPRKHKKHYHQGSLFDHNFQNISSLSLKVVPSFFELQSVHLDWGTQCFARVPNIPNIRTVLAHPNPSYRGAQADVGRRHLDFPLSLSAGTANLPQKTAG